MKITLLSFLLLAGSVSAADSTNSAATAINALGLDLLPKVGRSNDNALLSPYSIQSALAMTYAGADGATRAEMMRVLHFPKDDAEVNRSFAALRQALDGLAARSAKRAEDSKRYGMTNDPITLVTANRLFGQSGFAFRAPFLDVLKDSYDAPLAPLDFRKDARGATKQINDWVATQTRERIRDLVPDGALNAMTRLVLVNAVYLKAPWLHEFDAGITKPQPFFVRGGKAEQVPTMRSKADYGYAKRDGFTALVLPYNDPDLQLLILLPDATNGLAALEKTLTPTLLADCARPKNTEVILQLPKFKLEPPTIPLTRELQALGMKSAFDQPPGSANFDRMASRAQGRGLAISDVFHKTFLSLDEKGTEAAAATAVVMAPTAIAPPKPKPIEVKVDRPFLFAIQHRPSGACLFLGRLTDPRAAR
jgi:serpin B